jgi:hypothetical protein
MPRAHAHTADQAFVGGQVEGQAYRLRRRYPLVTEQAHLGVVGQRVQVVDQLVQRAAQRRRARMSGVAAAAGGDPGAAPALAYQQAFLGQFGQGQADGYPGNAQTLGQVLLARQLLAITQLAPLDLLAQQLTQLVVQRRMQIPPQQALQVGVVVQIHGLALVPCT